MSVEEVALKARNAAFRLAALDADTRCRALEEIAKELQAQRDIIFEANRIDVQQAETEKLSGPLLARLRFDEKKLAGVLEGIANLIRLEDRVGTLSLERELADGLILYRMACPIGVLGVIFESRPDALVQIATLCVKSGNAVILKGGHEAVRTNNALFKAVYDGGMKAGLPSGWAALLESRQDVNEMLRQDGKIDLLIPRGTNALVRYIMDNTHIPVLGHADGLCHAYVDADADLDMAVKVVLDAKTQNLSVCNAIETLLVHQDIAEAFLPRMAEAFRDKGVEIRGDERVSRVISCIPETEEDRKTEYLDAIISVEITDGIQDAIDYINRYGSHHTDCIITNNTQNAEMFTLQVDSAGVYVNCSTRFADGFRYGFGAEVGVSTAKLHARGPVGVDGLLTYKYKLIGKGQTVAETMDGSVKFIHRDLL